MFVQFKRGWVEQDLTQLSVIILCDDSTGCDEVDNYFATKKQQVYHMTSRLGVK